MSETLRAFLGARDIASITPQLLIHLNIFVYALAYWMQQPVLPFLSSELGVDKSTFGMLQSAISTFALVGGPLVGRLLDERGTKVAILVSQGGSLVMYGTMAMATSIPLLFASRIPATVQHAMLCAQAALSKLSKSEERAVALGRLSLSYALGMAAGAPLGGSLAKWYGSYFTAACACGVTLIIMVVDAFLLDAEKIQQDKKEESQEAKSSLTSKVQVLFNVITLPAVRDLLLFSIVSGMGLSLYQSMFSVAAKEHFKMDAQSVGFFISYGSMLSLSGNVFLVGAVTRRFGDLHSVLGATMLLALSLMVYSQTTTYEHLVAVQIPLGLSGGVFYTTKGSLMSKAGDDKTAGTRIALSHASRSLCGIVAPMIGGFLYDTYGFPGFGVCAAGLLVMSFLYMYMISGSHFKSIKTQ